MAILDEVSLTTEQRESVTQVLGKVMSACSEACYYAGWLDTTQEELPVLVEQVLETQQPQQWGHGYIDLPTSQTLKGLSLLLGNWATYDPSAGTDHFVAYHVRTHES